MDIYAVKVADLPEELKARNSRGYRMPQPCTNGLPRSSQICLPKSRNKAKC